MKKKMINLLLNELFIFNRSIERGVNPELLRKDFYRIDGMLLMLSEIGIIVECDMVEESTIVKTIIIDDKEFMYFDNYKFVEVK